MLCHPGILEQFKEMAQATIQLIPGPKSAHNYIWYPGKGH